MAGRKGPTPKKPWMPLVEGFLSRVYVAHLEEAGVDPATVRIWSNDTYEVTGHGYAPGQVHLSIKRLDRKPIMDWRHLQQIKNETCGDEAEAVQVFPAESRLVDEANQYHLYVMIPGFGLEGREGVLIRARDVDGHVWLEVGMDKRDVGTQADMDAALGTDHKGRQRDWQDGLTTGPIDKE